MKTHWLVSPPGTRVVGRSVGDSVRDRLKSDLRAKIQLAKRRLPLPKLMVLKGDGAAARSSARCPFHKDETPSFSVYQAKNGVWSFHCFAGCGRGDEVDYLVLKAGVKRGKAIALFLKLAGV